MQLVGIPASELSAVWEAVCPMIDKAATRSGLMSAQDVCERLDNREWQLWVATDHGSIMACLVTEIATYPQAKVCNFIIGTGRKREGWQQFRATIEQWAKAQGCTRMRVEARTGWARIFNDYKQTHVILEKEL